MMLISRPTAVHWPFGRRSGRGAAVSRAAPGRPAARSAVRAPKRDGLGLIWYLIPVLWLTIAVAGYVVLVHSPAVSAEPAPSPTATVGSSPGGQFPPTIGDSSR